MTTPKRYRRNPETVSGRIDDELVMMDIRRGQYFSLNPVATRIWDLLAEPVTLDGLCGALQEEYDVDPGQCRTDVLACLDELAALGLVEATGDETDERNG